jgi:putative spermidine/putrescine transport system permease protein
MLLLLLPGLIYLIVLFYVPIAHLVGLSFQANGKTSLHNYSAFFSTHGYVKSLEVTVYISAAVVGVCAIVGYALAYRIATLPPRWGNALLIAVAVPFWTSVLVRGFAWSVLLVPGGAVQSVLADLHIIGRQTDLAHDTAGLIIGMSQVMLPYMVFPIVAALRGIDPALPAAARSMGAGGFQTFRRVILPLSMPGVVAGGLLVFLINVGFYILPVLLGAPGDTFLSQVIDVQVNQVLDWGMASAMSVVLVAVTLAVFAVYARVFGLDRLSGTR